MSSNSAPPPAGSGWSWVKDELKSKADETATRIAMKNLTKDVEKATAIAEAARDKANEPSEFQKIKLGAIIGIFVLVIGWVGQWYTLQDKTDDTEEALTELAEKQTQDTKEIKESVKKVEKAVEDHIQEYKEKESDKRAEQRRQLKAISEVVRIEIKKGRRR